MQSAIDNNVIVMKIDHGEDLFEAISAAMDKHQVKSAIILTGIGMLDDFELGYFNGTDYRNEFFAKPKELVGLHGSVTTAERKIIHVHAAVAGEDHKVLGGHLQRASVCVACELTMLKIEGFQMSRVPDQATGLKLLSVH